jgi:taurine dioxygenase
MSFKKQKIQFSRLSQAGGALIEGIDLKKPLGCEEAEAIRLAWTEHLVLVARNQIIDEEDQERFCKLFGELAGLHSKVSSETPKGESGAKVLWVANIDNPNRPTAVQRGEMMFHIDQCYTEYPSKASTLYAVNIPKIGGNTRFSNLQKAYEELSDDWKNRLEGLRALNYFDYRSNATTRPKKIDPDAPQYFHPLVRTHSVSGQKSLFVNRQMTIYIEGVERSESDEILGFLFNRMEDPDNIYEHIWQVGDLVLWDNRCTAHARTHYDPEEARLLRRMTVVDECPVI